MAAHTHDCITAVTPAWPARWAEASSVRLSQRDIDGLIMAGAHDVPLALPAASMEAAP
jgi:hypothetical protein